MAIERLKKVELREYHASWKDSFIVLAMYGFRATLDLQKRIRSSERSITKAERVLKKLESKKDTPIEEVEKAEDALDVANNEHMEILIKVLTRSFRSGRIYDNDTKTERDLAKEDLENLDLEVITDMIGHISGTVEKKI